MDHDTVERRYRGYSDHLCHNAQVSGRDCRDDAQRPVLVLDAEGKLAICGAFHGGPGDAATVEQSVMPASEARRKGLERDLPDVLVTVARDDAKHAWIAAISGAYPGAVAFYAALGFGQVGHMPEVGYRAGSRLDLILMQKVLNLPDSGVLPG